MQAGRDNIILLNHMTSEFANANSFAIYKCNFLLNYELEVRPSASASLLVLHGGARNKRLLLRVKYVNLFSTKYEDVRKSNDYLDPKFEMIKSCVLPFITIILSLLATTTRVHV